MHNHATLYSIAVQAAAAGGLSGLTVSDYLPAEQEFLGCGGVDNTPSDSPSAPGGIEYPGAPNRAGFDGDLQASEDQAWRHHGSTPRNFGSARSG